MDDELELPNSMKRRFFLFLLLRRRGGSDRKKDRKPERPLGAEMFSRESEVDDIDEEPELEWARARVVVGMGWL